MQPVGGFLQRCLPRHVQEHGAQLQNDDGEAQVYSEWVYSMHDSGRLVEEEL